MPAIVPALQRMLSAQAHRGPDDEGCWTGSVAGAAVALGSSRLAILDLSPAGHQPMLSPCGRYVLTFNGEVYNYVELRQELHAAGCEFRSNSDTEVVLEALRVWGPAALARFNGMWGLAFLDRQAGTLLLARDRFGVKPLYLYAGRSATYVASEIKSVLEASSERFAVNPTVVARYLDQHLLDADRQTFFDGIEMVPAGHYLEVRLGPQGASCYQPRPYWQPEELSLDGADIASLIERVRHTFMAAVRLRLRSDVPVGVLLSGGLDSSSIAAAVRRLRGPDNDLHLFSAVSTDRRYSEAPFIDLMAASLEQTVEKVVLDQPPEQLFALLRRATWFNDEPIATFSAVAEYQLMQRAREHGVTVILNGQGADELLCGYRKYVPLYVQQLLRQGRIRAAAHTVHGFSHSGGMLRQLNLGHAGRYLPRRLAQRGVDIKGPLLRDRTERLPLGLAGGGIRERQLADLYRYSIPSIVHSEDRMSMAWSREVRLPFLDYRFVNLMLSLPVELKLRDGWTKWIFRRAMAPMLPPAIAWRKDKQGFLTPEEKWLKHDLRPQIDALLRGEMLTATAGWIDQANLRTRYASYRSGARGRQIISAKDVLLPITLEVWAQEFQRYLRW